jgi:hypothetical protein
MPAKRRGSRRGHYLDVPIAAREEAVQPAVVIDSDDDMPLAAIRSNWRRDLPADVQRLLKGLPADVPADAKTEPYVDVDPAADPETQYGMVDAHRSDAELSKLIDWDAEADQHCIAGSSTHRSVAAVAGSLGELEPPRSSGSTTPFSPVDVAEAGLGQAAIDVLAHSAASLKTQFPSDVEAELEYKLNLIVAWHAFVNEIAKTVEGWNLTGDLQGLESVVEELELLRIQVSFLQNTLDVASRYPESFDQDRFKNEVFQTKTSYYDINSVVQAQKDQSKRLRRNPSDC